MYLTIQRTTASINIDAKGKPKNAKNITQNKSHFLKNLYIFRT